MTEWAGIPSTLVLWLGPYGGSGARPSDLEPPLRWVWSYDHERKLLGWWLVWQQDWGWNWIAPYDVPAWFLAP